MISVNLTISEKLTCAQSPMFTGVRGCAKYTLMNNKIWILVPKNACSTIAFSSEQHNKNETEILEPIDSNKTVDWIKLNKNGTIIPNRLIIDYDLPRIAFYRDPIDRFCSLINYAYSNFHGKSILGCDYPALFDDSNLESTIRNFTIYCSIANMFNDVSYADQHAVSQSKYLEYCGMKNLTLYHVKDLKKVFEKEGIKHYTVNESRHKIVSRDKIPNYIMEQLNFIYRDDYNLEKLIQQVDAQ